ncbi:hypothetical protein V1280_008860 [Bradyrhizobium sp. AZCC 2230]
MASSTRAARVERAKALGRAAYRLARSATIAGNLEVRARKQPIEYRRGLMFTELWEPWRSSAFETEFSRLRVTYAGEQVLELRWNRANNFSVVLFKLGGWKTAL